MARQETASQAPSPFDSTDELNGLELAGTTIATLQGLQRGGVSRVGTLLTTAGAPARTQRNNLLYILATSGAAPQGAGRPFQAFPLQNAPATIPAAFRPRRQYRYDALAMADALAATGAFVGVAPLINSLTAQPQAGVEWYAATGLNGGAWTPRYRRVTPAGPLVTGPSSGIVLDATPHVLTILYSDAPVSPSVRWLIDDVEVFSVTDPAGVIDAGSVGLNLRPIAGTETGAAGTAFLFTNTRVRVFDPDVF